jgi:uncharacterized protein
MIDVYRSTYAGAVFQPPGGRPRGAAAMTGDQRHACPTAEPGLAGELAGRLRREPWLTGALDAVAASGLPDAWIGAGVLRDIVWGQLHEGFDQAAVRDVDVPFFDTADISRERDEAAQRRLASLADLPWEATNQAGVHTWYDSYFGGGPVEPFTSVHEAIATWPETATCVAVRRVAGVPGGDEIEVCAPHGLTDLLRGTWRRNPVRVTLETSRARLARQRVEQRWPGITVVPLA